MNILIYNQERSECTMQNKILIYKSINKQIHNQGQFCILGFVFLGKVGKVKERRDFCQYGKWHPSTVQGNKTKHKTKTKKNTHHTSWFPVFFLVNTAYLFKLAQNQIKSRMVRHGQLGLR